MSDTGPGSRAAARLRVLLLDDDSFMLELLHEMFDAIGGFEVHPAISARKALATLASTAPDLLVCDLSMPDMDGIEFMHAAAGAGFTGCVMLLSGMDAGVRKAAERLARAHGLRVLGAYKKPISPEQLRDALAPLVAGDPGACQDREPPPP